MPINRVVPNIQSAKTEESKAFYAETLGFDVAMDQGWIIGFASPTNPTAQIQILTADATAPIVPALSIEVDDVDALYATVQARGYPIVYPLTDEPWGVRRFFTRDPQGLVVNIVSHRPQAARNDTL